MSKILGAGPNEKNQKGQKKLKDRRSKWNWTIISEHQETIAKAEQGKATLRSKDVSVVLVVENPAGSSNL